MKITFSVFLFFSFVSLQSQSKVFIHSHNDYEQDVPFWKAYSSGANSIEVDVLLKNGKLYATHQEDRINKDRTINNLYLDPLNQANRLQFGNDRPVQLLIDFKSEAYQTLEALIKMLKKYPGLIHNPRYSFVISGNRPNPDDYSSYPDFIQFDYQSLTDISKDAWAKVALISLGFTKYFQWDGITPMSDQMRNDIIRMVNQAHAFGKPFRFWAFPDTPLAWQTAIELGIDFVNTDQPYACTEFVHKYIHSHTEKTPLKIAFLADVHLNNVFGRFSDSGYKGVYNPETKSYVHIRTMASQLHSTRIFNENYFAFRAALNDIAGRGIQMVALPGDYTDDGQSFNTRGLHEILQEYEKKYHMRFFITTGNHDPVGPFQQDAGKSDFMGEGGKNQPIFSKGGIYTPYEKTDLPVVVTNDIAKQGYQGIISELQAYGFMPQRNYRYWATPFSNYTPENYSFEKAQQAGKPENRIYDVIPGFTVPDASYVAEPVDGLWLLAIDGDVYIPKNKNGNPNDPSNYNGAGVGYNQVLSNKQHLLKWVKIIADEAKARHKVLIAFSHFPLIDYNDNATPFLRQLFGDDKFQLERVPDEAIAQIFADAGIKIHVAGHMHINDTGIRTTEKNNTVVNIQTPSLAAYRPGYKILTIENDSMVDVETVTVDSVPYYNSFFSLYETEHQFLKETGDSTIWDESILNSSSYHDFMLNYLSQLVQLRFLEEWPEPLKSFITTYNAKQIAQQARISPENLTSSWTGKDLLFDFYKLYNADVLALDDIPKDRIADYKMLIAAFSRLDDSDDKLSMQLKEFFVCLEDFFNGEPADHFKINLITGKLTEE